MDARLPDVDGVCAGVGRVADIGACGFDTIYADVIRREVVTWLRWTGLGYGQNTYPAE